VKADPARPPGPGHPRGPGELGSYGSRRVREQSGDTVAVKVSDHGTEAAALSTPRSKTFVHDVLEDL